LFRRDFSFLKLKMQLVANNSFERNIITELEKGLTQGESLLRMHRTGEERNARWKSQNEIGPALTSQSEIAPGYG